MKSTSSNPQNKPNLLNDYLNRHALTLTPKPTNVYPRVTFSPKSFNYSPKKPNPDSTNDIQIDTTNMIKSEVLGNSFHSKPTPTHLYKLNMASPTTGPNGYVFNSRIKDTEKSKTMDETSESTGRNEPGSSSGRKRKYTPNTLNANGRAKEGLSEGVRNKKNLEIQTRFHFSNKVFGNVKPETTNSMTKPQKGENSWLNGIVYPNSSFTPQVAHAQAGGNSFIQPSEILKDKAITPARHKRDTLLKAYGTTEARKRPVSSLPKPPQMQLKNNDHAFPDLPNQREKANQSANRMALSHDKNEELRLKYKLVRNDEGSFEISTPKENFTQLLSEFNKKAYDQQLKEIKSTLKNIRMTKGGTPSDLKETKQTDGGSKNFEVKGQQVHQDQEPESAKSNPSSTNKSKYFL